MSNVARPQTVLHFAARNGADLALRARSGADEFVAIARFTTEEQASEAAALVIIEGMESGAFAAACGIRNEFAYFEGVLWAVSYKPRFSDAPCFVFVPDPSPDPRQWLLYGFLSELSSGWTDLPTAPMPDIAPRPKPPRATEESGGVDVVPPPAKTHEPARKQQAKAPVPAPPKAKVTANATEKRIPWDERADGIENSVGGWATLEKNVCVVTNNDHNGKRYFDVRRWYPDGDTLKPGRQGITLSVNEIPNLIEALSKCR